VTALLLVTCDEHPDLPEDDRGLLAPLREVGFVPSIARWDDPAIVWRDWPLIVLRAPWNYHLRLPEFLEWLEARKREGTPFLNPPDIVRWNADKRYLRDLVARGISIVETRFIEPSTASTLAQEVTLSDWTDVVLKPSISAGAHHTVRFQAKDAAAHESVYRTILATGAAALLQPYLPQVERDGEWSFLFFDRQLSHVVVKRPAAGDFRVQEQYGGTNSVPTVTPAQRAAAQRVIDAVPGTLLYARVDGFFIDGSFLLGELELIEPSLFLSYSAAAPALYAQALQRLTHAQNR
jgi:glutathione synthase/RimK-type ligase-like ATP-grasp enzyme